MTITLMQNIQFEEKNLPKSKKGNIVFVCSSLKGAQFTAVLLPCMHSFRQTEPSCYMLII